MRFAIIENEKVINVVLAEEPLNPSWVLLFKVLMNK